MFAYWIRGQRRRIPDQSDSNYREALAPLSTFLNLRRHSLSGGKLLLQGDRCLQHMGDY